MRIDSRGSVRRIVMGLIVLGLVTQATGCRLLNKYHQLPPSVQTFSRFHQPDYDWKLVARVLVLPLANQTEYPRVDEEVAKALAAELQQLGRFEVVSAPPDDLARLSKKIHHSGKFDEAVMLEVLNETKADIILHGTITQYSPYPRPRLGMVLQAISPLEGKVVASVDGLWDSTRHDLAERIREHYRMRIHTHSIIVNNFIKPDDSYADELALDSPMLFQRYVCGEAVVNLVKDLGGPATNTKCKEPCGSASSPKPPAAWGAGSQRREPFGW